ncbi:DUF3179 domain-containing protein [uncultured Tenacibaculum sp.]|uniref:DUF3179 domain-containing protein n=1 Tax=uncultured Tenacibaculum sp. TaxID=174713 RepID=UPI002630F24C|nr:DUF3179 domain-containing protein [uncultured Tenacibaculum sp.]
MKYNLILLILLLITSCSSDDNSNISDGGNNNGNTNSGNNNSTFKSWSIPLDEIYDGAGKDGIPSIDSPVFLSGQDATVSTYMQNDDIVIGLKIGTEVRAYPHRIMDWHEVLNDDFNGEKITINYCPLTRTAFAWKYSKLGKPVKFGVSGLLYNSNLILYDRETNSNWSQMKLECVNGSELGKKPTRIEIVETNWETWKLMYPETKILSDNQGFARNYQNYPYGGYLDSDDFLFFPVSPLDTRLPKKERVHGVISSDLLKAYRFKTFEGGNVFKDNFNGKRILLVGNKNVIKSFEIPTDLTNLEFSYSYKGEKDFFIDNLGNKWSINGKVIQGPMQGRELLRNDSVTGLWFSLASFYPNPEIYN